MFSFPCLTAQRSIQQVSHTLLPPVKMSGPGSFLFQRRGLGHWVIPISTALPTYLKIFPWVLWSPKGIGFHMWTHLWAKKKFLFCRYGNPYARCQGLVSGELIGILTPLTPWLSTLATYRICATNYTRQPLLVTCQGPGQRELGESSSRHLFFSSKYPSSHALLFPH